MNCLVDDKLQYSSNAELLASKHASTLSKLRAKQATLTTERQETLEQAIDSDLDPDLPI